MSEHHHIEAFEIEHPPNLFKRGSGFSTDSNISEEENNSNDNIIFQEDTLDLGLLWN